MGNLKYGCGYIIFVEENVIINDALQISVSTIFRRILKICSKKKLMYSKSYIFALELVLDK